MTTINFIFKDKIKTATIGGNSNEFVKDVINLMPSYLDKDGFRCVSLLSRITPKLLENIDKLIEKYKDQAIEVYQIRSCFKCYLEGEPFFIIPKEISKEESEQFQVYLLTKDDPNPEKSRVQLEGIKKQISTHYIFKQQSGEIRVYIGEPDKSKRTCRYCLRSYPDVSFNQVAHTISEALGNKTIITNTECDDCNNRYGTGIEMDCANYHNFLRRLYNIKGKGPAKDGGTNFKIDHNEDGEIKIGIVMTNDEIEKFTDISEQTGRFIFPLRISQKYKPINIYRALCKYSLGILDDNDIPKFRSTIEWMDGKRKFVPLPKVAMLFPTHFRLSNPRISILQRYSDVETLPKAIGIVEFADIAYCFIIPVEGDTIKYDDDNVWNQISMTLPLYKPSIGWQLKDFSSDIQYDEIKNILSIIPRRDSASE